MVVCPLELQLLILLRGLVHALVALRLRLVETRIEETFAIFCPGKTTEFDPFENIVFQILAGLSIFDLDGGPVGAAHLHHIGQVFGIGTPVHGAYRGDSLIRDSVGIQEDLRVAGRIVIVDLETVLRLNFIIYVLVL